MEPYGQSPFYGWVLFASQFPPTASSLLETRGPSAVDLPGKLLFEEEAVSRCRELLQYPFERSDS